MPDTVTFAPDTILAPALVPAIDPVGPAPLGKVAHTIINPGNPWEITVGHRVAEALADSCGHILTGFEICDLKNRMIEIDNLLVCDRGVFVIECKALRGRIEGGLNLPWKLVQGDGSATVACHRGLNPRHQCRQQTFSVIEALERIGARRHFWINGAVIVPDTVELDLGTVPVDTYNRSGCPVYHLSAFARILAGLPRLTGMCGDPGELATIVEKLRR